MNFDKYLDRKYDSKNYNCAHFVSEAWLDLTGIDVSAALGAASAHEIDKAQLKRLTQQKASQGPAIALFQSNRRHPHVGLWFDGRILHITESGVEWTVMEAMMTTFNKVRFYNG